MNGGERGRFSRGRLWDEGLAHPQLPQRAPGARQWLPPKLVNRVVAALEPELVKLSRGALVFVHGDFHPGNLVWHRATLAGVVDWSHARLRDRWGEVANCRVELAVLHGQALADDFSDVYQVATGQTAPRPTVAVWDLYRALIGHGWVHQWVAGYRDQGRVDLSVDIAVERLAIFTERALSGLAQR
ncbi:MAG TPA: phosphotransferase [Acidimicrobiales bacterium]|nr:phosphotransferase [Acidimicrobiales bacterium]